MGFLDALRLKKTKGVSLTEYPPLGEVADDEDELDWSRERDGRMTTFATDDDDAVVTEKWEQ